MVIITTKSFGFGKLIFMAVKISSSDLIFSLDVHSDKIKFVELIKKLDYVKDIILLWNKK